MTVLKLLRKISYMTLLELVTCSMYVHVCFVIISVQSVCVCSDLLVSKLN